MGVLECHQLTPLNKMVELDCCGGKVLLRPEKKSIYFVVAGKFYYDQRKKFYLFCCGGKVLLRPEKKVLSILLWRESFITKEKKKFYLFCCGGKVLLRPEKKFYLF